MTLAAKTVDLDLANIPRREVSESSGERNSGGSAGEHEIARLEGEVLTEVPDDEVDIENELRRRRVLAGFAVDPAAQPDIAIVDLIGRDEPGAGRVEPGSRLALRPLSA